MSLLFSWTLKSPIHSYHRSALARDPDYWTNPDSFMPERFLGPDGRIIPKPRIVSCHSCSALADGTSYTSSVIGRQSNTDASVSVLDAFSPWKCCPSSLLLCYMFSTSRPRPGPMLLATVCLSVQRSQAISSCTSQSPVCTVAHAYRLLYVALRGTFHVQ